MLVEGGSQLRPRGGGCWDELGHGRPRQSPGHRGPSAGSSEAVVDICALCTQPTCRDNRVFLSGSAVLLMQLYVCTGGIANIQYVNGYIKEQELGFPMCSLEADSTRSGSCVFRAMATVYYRFSPQV